MIKGWMHDIELAIQARSGASPALFEWIAVTAVALLAAFVFLCIAADLWLTQQFGGIVAGLIMAGGLLVVAAITGVIGAVARRRAKERAILERAARAQTPSWLLDPKVLTTAVQVGRSLGWQRIVPIALVGLVAAQWAREHRPEERDDSKAP
jgi:hypothetical protein